MLKWRVISATIILAILFGLLHLDFYNPLGAPGIWLFPLIVVAAGLIVQELLDFWRTRDTRPAAWSVYLGTFVVIVASCVPMFAAVVHAAGTRPPLLTPLGWTWLGFIVALGIVVFGEMLRYPSGPQPTTAFALGLLAVSYAGVLPSFLVHLRLWHDARCGMGALISLILIVKASDTGAYFTGRAIGRHKLAPKLSPGKTIEGLGGGLVAAVAAAWISYFWLLPQLVHCETKTGQGGRWALFAVLVTLVGVLGDLTESLLKRDAGRKDSSRWLPGLGGILDIFDSILFAAPVAYFCWQLGLIGG